MGDEGSSVLLLEVEMEVDLEETEITSQSSDSAGDAPNLSTTSSVENCDVEKEQQRTSNHQEQHQKEALSSSVSAPTTPQQQRPILRKTVQGALVQAGSDPIFSSPCRSPKTSPAYAKKQLKPTGFGDVLKEGADVPQTHKHEDPNETLGQVYKSVSLRKAGNPDAPRPKPVNPDEHLGNLYKSVSLKKSPKSFKEKMPANTAIATLPSVTLHKTEIIKPSPPKFELPPEFSTAKQKLKHRIEKPSSKKPREAPPAQKGAPDQGEWTPVTPTKTLQPGSKEYYQEIKQRRGLRSGASRSVSKHRLVLVGILPFLFVFAAFLFFLSTASAQVPEVLQPVHSQLLTTTNHACMWLETNQHAFGSTKVMERVLQACPKMPATEPLKSATTEKMHKKDVKKVKANEQETKAPGKESPNKARKGPKWLNRLFLSPEARALAIQDL